MSIEVISIRTITCDEPGCKSQISWTGTQVDLFRHAESRRWSYRRDKQKCPAHREHRVCIECERVIRPYGVKLTEPGMERTVSTGVNGRCASCSEGHRKGTLHRRYKEIEAAYQKYFTLRPPSLQDYTEDTERARQMLTKNGAEDLLEVVGV